MYLIIVKNKEELISMETFDSLEKAVMAEWQAQNLGHTVQRVQVSKQAKVESS